MIITTLLGGLLAWLVYDVWNLHSRFTRLERRVELAPRLDAIRRESERQAHHPTGGRRSPEEPTAARGHLTP
jgi:hypothetical protein